MVNLEWYRTFKAIYETGTLTGAAESLFISQPGVSLHLSSLENYTGYKLFDRTSRKMVPTEKGKVLYNYVLDAILKLETAEQHFHRNSTKEKPTLSLGMCFETFQLILEPHLSKLPFNVIVKFGDYQQMINELDNGILDLIITPHKDLSKNLAYHGFGTERIVLIAGAATDTTDFERLMQQDDRSGMQDWLKQQLWFGTAGDMEHLLKFWFKNFNSRIDFKPNFIVPNMRSIIRCLSDEKGLAVIPDFLSREEVNSGKVKILWEGFLPMENTLHFASRKKTIYSDEIETIKKVFVQDISPVSPLPVSS